MSEYQRWKGIMKCYPFEEKRLARWNPPYIVQPKFDGDRCRNEPTQGRSILLTSEENIFYSVPHIIEQLETSGLGTLKLDGEIYSHSLHLEGGHELIHSIASRTINIHPRYKELEFWIFDIKNGNNQLERTALLNSLGNLPPNIKLTPYWICYTLDDVKRVYDKVIKENFEGIVIRHIMNTYTEKRSTYLMKFKPKKTDKYKIIGYKEEVSTNGVPKNRLGSLLLSSQDGDTFSVSAGLDDDERNHFWKFRDLLIGKYAIVHYQHLTNKGLPKGCFDLEILE